MDTITVKEMKTYYDVEQDILYLTFVEKAEASIAEEIADEVFVRFNPETHKIITIEFLNMSARLTDAFGAELKFLESAMPERKLLPFTGD
jgi:uncharacterized protein YuzE